MRLATLRAARQDFEKTEGELMQSAVLSIHPGLAGSSRVPVLAEEGQWSHVTATVVLLGAGVGAALATVLVDFSLRIPGHAILRAVFPMALGLALAPRRRGGAVMGAAALCSAMVIKVGGWATPGIGALAALALTGPFLDAALWRARKGWRLYLAFAVAGLSSNLAALVIRAGAKSVGFEPLTARPLAVWWFQAVGTYALCGLLAGLLSAMIWFRFSSKSGSETTAETAS